MIKSLKKAALNHKTTLGKNDALPDMFDTSYEYGLLDKRFKEVEEELHKVDGLLNTDHDYLMEVLGRKFKECKNRERPIRHELERLCGETVVKMLGIPEGTMTIMCELVDEIRPNYKLRITPTDEDLVADNTQELGEIKKEVLKRRFINSLIQGISYSLMKDDETYLRSIYKIDKELLSLYEDIVRINDYILFTTNIKIDENNPMQGSYVESILGQNGEMSHISAQGLIFPLLLQETYRGCLEVFSSHYIIHNKNYKTIINNADYLQAEQWDLRLGVPLWNILGSDVDNTEYIPYYFASICDLDVDDFNSSLKEVYANTRMGKEFIENLLINVKKKFKLNKLTKNIEDGNDVFDTNEGYFAASELNDFLIEDDGENNELSEDDIIINDLIERLPSISVDSIDFSVGESQNNSIIPSFGSVTQYQLYPIIDNQELPINIVNFQAEERKVGDEILYQVHLFINERLQNKGLGFKLLYAFVRIYGNIYIGKGRMLNQDEIPHLINKLAQQNDIQLHKIISKSLGKCIGYKLELKR